MDKKVYEKTRYQNIYRHKKNKNYIVMISKPYKSSISSFNGEKIYRLEDALKLRDNPKNKNTKKNAVSTDFDTLYTNYTSYCKNTLKLAKNSLIRKHKTYKKYLSNVFYKKITKLTETDFTSYIEKLNCTPKTKNEIIKELKAFLNWCVKEDILLYNPAGNIKKYKTFKSEMKYWNQEEIKKFFSSMEKEEGETAYRVRMFALITFSLGCRTIETRNLTFENFNNKTNVVIIKGTKTKTSDREIDVSQKLIDEVKKYKWHLINQFNYDILENELIFCNHKNKKPLSDTLLRKQFYFYCDKLGISRIRLYDLRHTFVATAMSENKELYLISQRLGHSSYNTTVDKYGHLSNEKRKEIAELTDKYV